jgi:hypothetical protein
VTAARPSRWAGTAEAAAVLAAALLLAWPALVNGYPILFADTQAYLYQAAKPWMLWDKPWVYGPFLQALHGFTTLWLPLAGQALLLSLMLRLVELAVAPAASPGLHLLLVAVLAAGSAAPWVASLLLPDVFAPLTVLGLFVLAFGERRAARRCAGAVATLAITAHLSHLIVAAACLLGVALLRPGRVAVAALPLGVALVFLAGSNLAGFGRLAISPSGSVFFLARLVADGPARDVLLRECPHPGWRLCAWVGRLPADSDAFLWPADGPVWSYPGGPIALAPEAAEIVWHTLRAEPSAVLRGALRNTAAQLTLIRLGDTLGPEPAAAALARLREIFPPAEPARFAASLQATGRLRPLAAPLNAPDAFFLLLGAVATPLLLARALHRRQRALAGLATLVLVGILANAAATGALSGPFDRYQTRIAWLLLVVPGVAIGVLRTRDRAYEPLVRR